MEIPVSIALFFLLSGFFLFTLLAALQRSGKAGIAAGVCLVAVALVIGLAKPVALWKVGSGGTPQETTTTDTDLASSTTTDDSVPGNGSTTTSSTASSTTSTTLPVASSWEETFKLEARW